MLWDSGLEDQEFQEQPVEIICAVDAVHEDDFGEVSFEMYMCVMVIASISRTSKSDSVYYWVK